MIEELVSRTFAIRNAAHLAHWRAKGAGSFAKHMALGDFYDDIIEKVDHIVEAHQACSGELIGPVKLAAQDTRRDILAAITEDYDWATAHREDIADGNPSIENMIDDLCGTYQKVIYKLTFLA
jgi:DNA-binding ferritin-like protein